MTEETEQEEQKGQQVDVHQFDIVQTEYSLFQITIGDEHLLTYAGDPACHRSIRLIQQIIEEFDGEGRIFIDENKIVDPHFNLSYTILCIQKRMIETGLHPENGFARWIAHDPILYRCAGPEVIEQFARWGPVLEYLAELGINLPSLVALYHDPSEFDTQEEYEEAIEANLPDKAFCDRIEAEFEQLLPEEKAVVLHLACIHHGLVLFPMALVTGRCTPTDYARGAMAAHTMLVDIFSDIKDEEYKQSFEQLRSHTNLALSYLSAAGITELGNRYVKDKPVRSEEDRNCEFKEVRGNDPVRQIKNTADEYVVSFLNSGEGGHILWGIRDADRVVVGVPLTYVQRDKLRLDLVSKLNEIQPRIDPTKYRVSLHPVIGSDNSLEADLFVIEVHVPAQECYEPYYTGGHECFVRVDGCKKKLGGPALTDWIKEKLTHHKQS